MVVVGVTLAVIAFGLYWAGPVALSIWTARKLPDRARLVPVNLKDPSISEAAGSRLSYFDHEFELPWSDIDGSRTHLDPNLNRVDLKLRSGLQVSATVLPGKDVINGIASGVQLSPQLFDAFVTSEFGTDANRSDYEFLTRLYDFTPEKMNRWALSPSTHYREAMLLTIKSMALLPWAADSGVFKVCNADYKGFQQGNPQTRPTGIVVSLYSDDGGIEFVFNQKNYDYPAGVSQAEINRVIQSVRKMGARTGD